MGTELPTKVMLGQTLVLMQMTFLNNVRKVSRLVLSRTSCYKFDKQELLAAFLTQYTLKAICRNKAKKKFQNKQFLRICFTFLQYDII
jgi:hypothetical protein